MDERGGTLERCIQMEVLQSSLIRKGTESQMHKVSNVLGRMLPVGFFKMKTSNRIMRRKEKLLSKENSILYKLANKGQDAQLNF